MAARSMSRVARCAGWGVALLLSLQLFALLRAPDAWRPSSAAVRLAPGESVTLAPLARATLLRDAGGRWLLAAQEDGPAPVLFRAGAAPETMGAVPLEDEHVTLPGGHRVARLASPAGSVAYAFGASHWLYDGARVLRDGRQQADCPDARWHARAGSLWNRAAPSFLALARPARLGGNLHCGNRIGIPGVLPDAASIVPTRGGLRITDLEHRPRALDGVQAIGIGALRLAPTLAGSLLQLEVQRRAPVYSQPALQLPPQVQWRWSARGTWPSAPHGWLDGALLAALAGALACCIASAMPRPGRPRCMMATAAMLVMAGLASLLLQRAGQEPAALVSLAIAVPALAVTLLSPRMQTLAGASAAVLLAAGLLAQLELGLGGASLRYYHKSCALLGIGLGALALWRSVPAAWRQAMASQRGAERSLLALAAIALAALAAQVLWGNETGVFELQPVELAKLALAALTAHCLALRFGWHEAPHLSRWLALGAPVLLFSALVALALVQVDDYSPLVLLCAWAAGMALAYACCAGRRALAGGICVLAIGSALGVGALRDGGAASVPENFYADRFQAWLAPADHPHTGQQLLRAAQAIADGGLAGADHGFGLRALGLPAGAAATIPAVQDDFAPAFFLNRHGLAGALGLWCLQALFLCGLLQQAFAAHRRASQGRDFRHAWAARFRCFALCGGAAFVGAHLLLSWGTNLAMLPVMGQPMSFLSAGGSHLLFFLLPLLGLSAASNEE